MSGGQVFDPVAQGRHDDVDNAEAVEQILAELSRGHALREIAIGRRDDADVHVPRRLLSDRLDFAALQKSEQHRLHSQAHLADFVQEQGAAVGFLDHAAAIAVGAGEAAPHVSEQL